MKYIVSILLILIFTGCSSPAGRTMGHIGKQINNCCSRLCITKATASFSALPADAEPIPVSAFEVTAKLPTW